MKENGKKDWFRSGRRLLVILIGLVFLMASCGKAQPVGAQTGAAAVSVQERSDGKAAAKPDSELKKKGGKQKNGGQNAAAGVTEDGEYTSKEEVAAYLHQFGHLPSNYITKKEAEALGWDSREGNLWEVAPGKSIGGSRFGNYEGSLPDKDGRKYFECDIDFEGGYRGKKRIVYSNDGLIYYTEDHYKTFEKLY